MNSIISDNHLFNSCPEMHIFEYFFLRKNTKIYEKIEKKN